MVEVQAIAGADLALSVERQMIAIFRDQQMRQHAGSGTPTRRRQRRSRCLGNRVAAPTGVFRPPMPDPSEPAGDIVENLGDVLAKSGHVAAASRTGAAAVVLWFVHGLLTRQMVW